MQSKIPTPVIVGVIVVVVLLAGFLLFKGATGGTVTDGHEGSASDPGSMSKQKGQ